jgi:hypothetical protein
MRDLSYCRWLADRCALVCKEFLEQYDRLLIMELATSLPIGDYMAGRRIDDFGGYPNDSEGLMKSKTHLKSYRSADGSGHVGTNYSDTTEMVHRDQEHGNGKIKGHPMKPGYRY